MVETFNLKGVQLNQIQNDTSLLMNSQYILIFSLISIFAGNCYAHGHYIMAIITEVNLEGQTVIYHGNCEMNYVLEMNNESPINFTKFMIRNGICKIHNGYYFIKRTRNTYYPNITFPKLIYSNYPDTGYMPLVVALYGQNPPEFILYSNQDNLRKVISDDWIARAFAKLRMDNSTGVVFGGQTEYKGEKVGISLALIRSTVVRELLYYSNATSESIPPLLALSLLVRGSKSNKIKMEFYPSKSVVSATYTNLEGKYPVRLQYCPEVHPNSNHPKLAILMPHFKRVYTYQHLQEYAKQDFQPTFYLIFQNDNRFSLDFDNLSTIVQQPIYHIWLYNWNSLFFLSNYASSLFNVDFVYRYDDDMYSTEHGLHNRILKMANNKDVIIGDRFGFMNLPICDFNPQPKMIPCHGNDHVATPTMFRPFHAKLDGRNNPHTYVGGEDIGMSISSNMFCGTGIRHVPMNVIAKHSDGKNHQGDSQIQHQYKIEKHEGRNLYFDVYCHYIIGGYMPKCWTDYSGPGNRLENITFPHFSF